MFSERFGTSVVVTDHARRRMAARAISEFLLLDIIETGEVRYKDESHVWIAKYFGPGGHPNSPSDGHFKIPQ